MNANMTCEEITGHLALYRFGELTGERAAQVEVHLASCARCRRELEGMELALSLSTQPMPGRAESAAVAGRVMASLGRNKHRRLMFRLAPAFTAAALIIGALSALHFGLIGGPGGTGTNGTANIRPVVAIVAVYDTDPEMFENLDLLANLEMFEDMDTVEGIEEL